MNAQHALSIRKARSSRRPLTLMEVCQGLARMPRPDDSQDLLAYELNGDAERPQHLCGKAVLLTEQAQQKVFGTDVVVLEPARLLLRQDDDLAGGVCESLKQASRIAPTRQPELPAPRPIQRRNCRDLDSALWPIVAQTRREQSQQPPDTTAECSLKVR